MTAIERLVIEVFAFLIGSGFLVGTWKIAWGIRGFVDAEKARARSNEELVGLVREFVDSQRVANELQRRQNDEIWTAVQVHAYRLNDLERGYARADGASSA